MKTFKDIVWIADLLILLDYVDLNNLSRTNRSCLSICNDQTIKQILSVVVPNVVFNMNVSPLLKKLDCQIFQLIDMHYDLPEWVHREKFFIHMKKKVYANLTECINENSERINKNWPKKQEVELWKPILAFALVSNMYEKPFNE